MAAGALYVTVFVSPAGWAAHGRDLSRLHALHSSAAARCAAAAADSAAAHAGATAAGGVRIVYVPLGPGFAQRAAAAAAPRTSPAGPDRAARAAALAGLAARHGLDVALSTFAGPSYGAACCPGVLVYGGCPEVYGRAAPCGQPRVAALVAPWAVAQVVADAAHLNARRPAAAAGRAAAARAAGV